MLEPLLASGYHKKYHDLPDKSNKFPSSTSGLKKPPLLNTHLIKSLKEDLKKIFNWIFLKFINHWFLNVGTFYIGLTWIIELEVRLYIPT